jgi:GT2 family glycosyltransferase
MTLPYFSVIIPTKSRPKSLAACLEALSELDYPRDRFEVIVIDDGSEMPPSDVTRSFCDRLDVVLLVQPQAGPAAARNSGVARAKGDFLAFTDDDCAPATDWLQRLAARFAQGKDQAVGGKTINGLPDDPYATASQLIVDVVYAYYNADPDCARFVASNNLAIAKDHLQSVGGFDSSFPLAAEDRDLCDRWLHQRYRITYAPEVVVHHSRRMSLIAFCRQHFSYGRGAFLFQRARVRRGSGHLVKELGFYRSLPSLVRRCLAQNHGRMSLLTVTLLAVWQIANAAGFFWEWVNQAQRRFMSGFRPEPRITNAPVKTDPAV